MTSFAPSFAHLPTRSLTCRLTHLLILLIFRSFACLFAHFPACLLIGPLVHSFACSFACLIIRSFAYSIEPLPRPHFPLSFQKGHSFLEAVTGGIPNSRFQIPASSPRADFKGKNRGLIKSHKSENLVGAKSGPNCWV